MSHVKMRKKRSESAAGGGQAALSRVDSVIVGVARLLVSNRTFQAEDLLERVGRGLKAVHVYLVTIPPDGHGGVGLEDLHAREGRESAWPSVDTYTYHEWQAAAEALAARAVVPEAGGGASSLAIPILSQNGLLYGYLGIDYGGDDQANGHSARGPSMRDTEVLHVLGDMLATYLERQWAEAALSESRERYRAFVSAVMEGIWAVKVDPPIDTNAPIEAQHQALREHAVVVECNGAMARLLDAEDEADILGQKASEVVPESFENSFFEDFLALGYTLRHREYVLHQEGEPVRHLRVNALGTVEDGRLNRVWASWTDVTERVELERRMVTALEQQQERIGRELHDGIGQLLTGIRMLVRNLVDEHADADDQNVDRAKSILRFTQEASQAVSELQRGLAPGHAQDDGLAEGLTGLATSTDGLSTISCTFDHDGQARVEEQEVRLQLYRIAQEATNNALKHAAPSRIEISFALKEGRPVLEVHDDGCGFDVSAPPQSPGQSLGLHSMHYRARSVGATLTINSTEDSGAGGAGTTVRCALPRRPYDD